MISLEDYAIDKTSNNISNEIWLRAWQSTCKRAKHFKLPKKPFKDKMESLFVDGMCWENYGEWEVDH